MFAVGSFVAGYRIEHVIASGATGTVYSAKNPTLPRRDALKVLGADLSQDPAFRERFVREADIASLLAHPNIVSIYNRGEAEDGQLWIAMQYVEGTDAEAALYAGTMTPARAVRIVGEVAKALDYAHGRGVVHHDVKPGNILLANGSPEDEHVLLSDFGVARAVGHPEDDSGQPAEDLPLAATLAYAAPEVIIGDSVDGRADIYSLACTAFRLLTSKQLFYDAEGPTAVVLAHLNQTPPRISDHLPGATRQLDVVMARALAKSPADRFASARQFAAAVAAASTSLTAHSTSATPPGAAAITATVDPLRPNASERGAGRRVPIRVSPVLLARSGARRPVLILWAVAAAVAIVAAILWARLLWPSSTPPEAAAPVPSMTTPSATAMPAALAQLLPPGYPRGTCTAAATVPDVTAAVSCGPNADPGGPASASYTLYRDLAGLQSALTETVKQSRAMICPPNIQSPGPWRRNDSPTVPRGTLFCGVQAGQPVVAWTTDEKLLLSVVRAGAPDASLAGLYAWWGTHS